jgi:Tfp pilus assembly pilus retraction ATPase PilT
MPYSMPDLMQLIASEQAEALHLYRGQPPVLEVRRTLHKLEGPKLKPEDVDQLFHEIVQANNLSELASEGMVSFFFHFADTTEFHVMAFREDGPLRLEIRRST